MKGTDVYYLLRAAQMLDTTPDNLPPIVVNYLNDVHALCEKAGGALVSRQAIATVIYGLQRAGKLKQLEQALKLHDDREVEIPQHYEDQSDGPLGMS